MHTSLLTISLLLAPVVADATPAWQTGYSAALDAGQKQKRPVSKQRKTVTELSN